LGAKLVNQARSGRVLALPPAVGEQQIRLYGEGGELVATAHSVSVGGYHPDRVFPGAAL
jgi:hypothetical protein